MSTFVDTLTKKKDIKTMFYRRVVRPVRQPPKDAFGFAPGVAAPEQIGALPIYDGL